MSRGKKLSEQLNVKFTNYVYLRQKHTITSEMSWCNIL